MEMRVLGSSSKGNCYILQNDKEALIIEAGVPLKDVKRALGWNTEKVSGCIITHRHNDHAGHAAEFAKAGFTILALPDVIEAKQLTRRATAITPGKGYLLGNFRVAPFWAVHDVPCVGYIISHPESGKTVFATDTYAVAGMDERGQVAPYTFADVNHWMIEANYTTWIVDRNIKNGNLTQTMKNRLMVSHLSLGNAIKALQRHDLTQTKDILLIHLSDGNSDERMFVKRVRDATGKRVTAAKANLVLDYSRGII